MKNLIEICWHGRGGQGAVTASKVLAESALAAGKFIQAFPEYGPERMGAPIRSFTRLSSQPITIHSQVSNPGVVVVLDPTLIGPVDVCEGLPEDGTIIVNTPEQPGDIRKMLGLDDKMASVKVFTVDATKIALETIGKNIPNTPMIGALIKATDILELSAVVEDFKKKYAKKFKPEILDGNVRAIEKAYNEVKGESA